MRGSIRLAVLIPLLTGVTVGQPVFPTTLPFQGRLVKQIGGNVNGVEKLTLRLYTLPTGGAPIWTEVQPAVSVTNGLFKTELGSVTALPVALFDGRTVYLGVQVGTDPEMVPRLVLTSQAYARLARNAQDVKGHDIHPSAVWIGATQVIDPGGRWVGSPTGLRGPKGARGPTGPTGPLPTPPVTWSSSVDTVTASTSSTSSSRAAIVANATASNGYARGLEGNESGTYFRGKARLANGRAEIAIPEEWRLVTAREGITVQVTPVGTLTARLAVMEQTRDRIVVEGTEDCEFNYFVNGTRRGFADYEPYIPSSAFQPRVKGVPFGTQHPRAIRDLLVRNGILNPDYTPNEATAERLGWKLIEPDDIPVERRWWLSARERRRLRQDSSIQRSERRGPPPAVDSPSTRR
jgi:hypothetical protein